MDYVPPPAIEYVCERPELGVSFKLANDNRILTNNCFIPFLNNFGDDFGFTHGMSLNLFSDLPGNLYLDFELGSNLYTRSIINDLQFFVNENYAQLIIDNLQKKGLFHEIITLGYHIFQSEDENCFLAGTAQQINWHEFLVKNGYDIRIPENVPEDYRQEGVFFSYLQDVSNSFLLTQNSALNLAARGGVTVSTIRDASSVDLQGLVTVGYKPSFFGILLEGTVNLKLHEGGLGGNLEGRIQIGTDNFTFSSGIRQKFGESLPVRKYDENYDLEHYIEFSLNL